MNPEPSLEENIHSAFRNTDKIVLNNRKFDVEKHFAGEGYDNPFYTAEKSVSLRKILRNTANSIMTSIATLPLFIGGAGTIFAGETPSVEDHLKRDTPKETYNPQSKKDKKNQKKTQEKQEEKSKSNPYRIDPLDIVIGDNEMKDVREGEIIRGIPSDASIYVEPQTARDGSGMRTSWGIKPISDKEYNSLLKSLNAEERKLIKQSVDRDAKGEYDLDKFGYIAVRGRRVVSDDESQLLADLKIEEGEIVKIVADYEKDEETPPEESTFFYAIRKKSSKKEEKEETQPKETARPSRREIPYKIPMRTRIPHTGTRAQPQADEPVVQDEEDDFKPSGIVDLGLGFLDMGYKPAKEDDPSFSTNGFKVRGIYIPNNWLTLVGNFDVTFDSDWIGGNASENFSLWVGRAHAFVKPPVIPLGLMASIVYQNIEHNGISSLYSNFENRSSTDISGKIGAGILTPQNLEMGLYAMGVVGLRHHSLDRDQISGMMVRNSHRSLSEGRSSYGYVVGGHIGRFKWPVSIEVEHGRLWNSSLGTVISGDDNPYWDKPLIFESGDEVYYAAQLSARIFGPLGLFVNARYGENKDIYEGENLDDLTKHFTISGGVRLTLNPNKK